MTNVGMAADYLLAYSSLRERLAGVVLADDCNTPVPACPGWQVHDVVAHLLGLCEDWVSQLLDGYASDAWTANHVSRHAHHTCEEILKRWRDAIFAFGDLDDLFLGLPPARWAFGDAVVHEADIRGALAVGRVPIDVVLLALRSTIVRWQDEVLSRTGLPTLHIRL
jgi:mycothiol maleylpyruvate isomerase-like protein